MIGLTSPDYIQRCDTMATDAGIAYTATITTHPLMVAGLMSNWGAMNATLLATANASAAPVVRFIRDFGLENSQTIVATLAPKGAETLVIVDMDNLAMSEATSIQVQFSDV